jgi:UDP-N-acetylenolpyruvoylglucosamine reductase
VLVADDGFPGMVLHIALMGVHQEDDTFRVAAGENWDSFVSLAIERGYGGLECLAGIPGTVGGTPVQNVGAYGQEVSGAGPAPFDVHRVAVGGVWLRISAKHLQFVATRTIYRDAG